MIFQKVEPDLNFDVVKYSSRDGEWEIGVHRVIFGYRVCGNPIWEEWSKNKGMAELVKCQHYTFNYCAGADMGFLQQLLVTMLTIFEVLPSTVTEREVMDMLPEFRRKPINIEGEECWPKLQELASSLLLNQPKEK
jgi:hypothetical protein